MHASIWEFPKIRGTLLCGPYNKDPTILGYSIWVPNFRKLPYTLRCVRFGMEEFGIFVCRAIEFTLG